MYKDISICKTVVTLIVLHHQCCGARCKMVAWFLMSSILTEAYTDKNEPLPPPRTTIGLHN